jgi:Toprim-like
MHDRSASGWRSFATGGSKLLFQFGNPTPKRLCVTEAAIDALSLAALEFSIPELFQVSLYVSTGGGWSRDAGAQLCKFAQTCGLHVVAATDRNRQGQIYAERLRALALEAGCRFSRLLPTYEDWNEDLKALPQAAARSEYPENENENLKKSERVETCCRVPEGARQG